MNFCSTWHVTGTSASFTGKTKAGPSPLAGINQSMLLYASRGHHTEPGIANTGTNNTLLPKWFVFLHLNCTKRPISPIKTSEQHTWRFLSKAFCPMTTKFDFLDSVKKVSNNSTHKVASNGAIRSNKPCTLRKICGERGPACRIVWGFRCFSPFNVSFSSILSIPGKGTSSKACRVRTPLM